MTHPDTYLKNTAKGLGLFAKRRFERGTILWIADDYDLKIPLDTYMALDDLQRRKMAVHGYIDCDDRMVVQWDEGKYINHSCAPNLTGVLGFDNLNIAMEPIEADEEIVDDYRVYYYGHFWNFTCRCGAPNCQGKIEPGIYLPEQGLPMDEARPLILSLPQSLLQVRSSENDAFYKLLYEPSAQVK